MRTIAVITVALGALLTASVLPNAADDAAAQAIKKDRKKIEGTWRVVALEIDGNKVPDQDARNITVVNRADGTWSIQAALNDVGKGSSQIDPTKKPKTIDFAPEEGPHQGQTYLGIYEIEGNTRKLCFAGPGKDRPTTFSAQAGSGHTLVMFEREQP